MPQAPQIAKSKRRIDPNAKARREQWKTPKYRPRHYNKVQAAYVLGISRPTLDSYAGDLFKPAGKKGRMNIYTDAQLDIISLVLRGKITEERGLELWRDTEQAELMTVIKRAHSTPS